MQLPWILLLHVVEDEVQLIVSGQFRRVLLRLLARERAEDGLSRPEESEDGVLFRRTLGIGRRSVHEDGSRESQKAKAERAYRHLDAQEITTPCLGGTPRQGARRVRDRFREQLDAATRNAPTVRVGPDSRARARNPLRGSAQAHGERGSLPWSRPLLRRLLASAPRLLRGRRDGSRGSNPRVR